MVPRETLAQAPPDRRWPVRRSQEYRRTPANPKAFRSNYAVDPFSQYPAFVDTGTALVDKYNVDLYLAGAAQAGQQQ